MSTLLAKLLEQLNSSVFVLLGIFVCFCVLLFKAGGWLATWREKYTHHDTRIEKTEQLSRSTHDTLVALTTKVDMIYEFTNPRSLARSQSPTALTELGVEVSEKIKADEIFSRYADSLSDEITAQCPTESTAYDIQAAAFKIAKKRMPEILSATEIEALKKVAFDYGIILDDMWIIFGILLRDKTLAERNIPVIEVDRHAPT